MTATLGRHEVVRLVFLWIDRGVRQHTATALAEAGHAAAAEALRTLAEIHDRETCLLAEQALDELKFDGLDVNIATSVSTLTVTIRRYLRGTHADLFWVSIGTLTAAALAGFDDERSQQLEDVRAALGGSR